MVALTKAKDQVVSAKDDAIDRLAPALEDTLDKITPVLADARAAVLPVAQQAIAEAGRKGRQAASKVGLAEEEKETHRLRSLVVLLLLAGIAVAIYKKVSSSKDPWTEMQATSERDSAPAAPAKSASPAASTPSTSGSTAGTTAGSTSGVTGKSDDSTVKATTKPGPAKANKTAQSAPLAGAESAASSEPTTPDSPLEETKVEKSSSGS